MKRPVQHETDAAGQRLLRAAFEGFGWVVNALENDYGADYEVEIFEDALSTGATFKVQLKSSASTQYSSDGTVVSQPIRVAKGGVLQTEAVAALYSDYRNPLAHAWAVSTREVGRHPNKRIIMDGNARVLGVVKQALTEQAIAALETPSGRAPSWLTPVVMRNSAGGLDLYPHSLYWGTRRMVEKLARDRARMRQTVALFATMATPASEPVSRPG